MTSLLWLNPRIIYCMVNVTQPISDLPLDVSMQSCMFLYYFLALRLKTEVYR